jgi:N-acylneuraminate cytidylyltransferase
MNKNKTVCIIPARGGSKRIRNKNVIDFLGKPLIAWTIEAAKKSGLFNKIIVSTDDSKIAEISKEWGAEVPFLRLEKADDFSPVSEATLSTLLQVEKTGENYDTVVQLFAVCPLRNEFDIIDSIKFFNERNLKFLISCYKYTWMNPWWAVKLDEQGHPDWIFKDTQKRSQDLPDLFSPTGAIWIADIPSLKKAGTFYGEGHVFWEMDWKRAIDIDNYEDIELAKAFHTLQK